MAYHHAFACIKKAFAMMIYNGKPLIFTDFMLYYTQGGDFVNFNKSNTWTTISYCYLIFLFVVIFIYDPDFLKIENCLLFVPLYVPIIVASHIKHKKDEFAEGFIWETRWSLIVVTAIVAIVKMIVVCFK